MSEASYESSTHGKDGRTAWKRAFDHWIATSVKENRPRIVQRLQDLVKATCIRPTKASSSVHLHLAKPCENTHTVALHGEDKDLYAFFRQRTMDVAAGIQETKRTGAKSDKTESNILSLMSILRLICNYGEALLPPNALSAWHQRDSTSVNWKMMTATRKTCTTCGVDIGGLDGYGAKLKHTATNGPCSFCEACSILEEEAHDRQRTPRAMGERGGVPFKPKKAAEVYRKPSAKVDALLRNLGIEQRRGAHGDIATKRWASVPLKISIVKANQNFSVIFSYWTKMLDLIEAQLERHGYMCRRIDGQSTLEARNEALRQFNAIDECTVMLASIGSCGEG